MATQIDAWQAALLALVQGLTEFLPISSSAHLALVPMLTEWPDQGLAFDCVVHLGSLTAVVWYFRQDLLRMIRGWWRTVQARSLQADHEGRMAWYVLLATIPVGLAGLMFKDVVEQDLRSLAVIGLASVGFGVLLFWSDRYGRHERDGNGWTLGHAMLVGCAQMLALIPGTSRSGITMTMALALGYRRQDAARFSFLLSIPVIALAGALKIRDWLLEPASGADGLLLLLGFVLAAVSAWLCIHYFLRFIERLGMGPFVAYRIGLGLLLLWMAF